MISLAILSSASNFSTIIMSCGEKLTLPSTFFDRVHEKLCASNPGVDKKPTTFHCIPTAHMHTMPRSHLNRHQEPRSFKPGYLEQYNTNINNNLHQQNNHHFLMDRLELIMLDLSPRYGACPSLAIPASQGTVVQISTA